MICWTQLAFSSPLTLLVTTKIQRCITFITTLGKERNQRPKRGGKEGKREGKGRGEGEGKGENREKKRVKKKGKKGGGK